MAIGLSTLAACSSAPKSAAPEPVPAVVSMDEWMERGAAAVQAGNPVKAREAWRAAAQAHPTAKQPWLKLAESHFNAGDYGNAVLAAQEALQREPRNRLANSVIAVSGLRLAAGSLATLRDESAYPVGSRDEAIVLTRTLREALAEPVLVPQNDPSKRAKRPARAVPGGTESHAVPAASTVSPLVRSPVSGAPLSANPLDKLK